MFYVMAHKKFDDSIVPKEDYKILWLSKSTAPQEKYIRDADYEDNISERNHHYSEMTGLYWIWKNGEEKPEELVGIVHYRRFFYSCLKKLSLAKAENLLEKYDIVLPIKRNFFPMTVRDQYGYYHISEDLQKAKDALEKHCPEYLPLFEKLLKGYRMCICNMMITKKAIFDEYCSWLFPIMETIEESTDFSQYDGTIQERMTAYLAERLFNVWMMTNSGRFKIKYLPVFMTKPFSREVVKRNLRDYKHRLLWLCGK